MTAEGALLELKAVLAILIIEGNLRFGHPTPTDLYNSASQAISNINYNIQRKYTPIPEDWHKDERNWV